MSENSVWIETFCLGPFMTNCSVVTHRKPAAGVPCWVVDCGFEAGPMFDYIERHGLEPAGVVLTHAHCDHIAGLHDLRQRLGAVPIWLHEAEKDWPGDPSLNLSEPFGMPMRLPEPDHLMYGGETLELDGQSWRVLHTPGHSPGGVSLVHDASNTLFAGDTLFDGSIGRYDFPGSSFDVLADSIRTKLYTLPDETRVLPGHLGETTIGKEKTSNPFVRPE